MLAEFRRIYKKYYNEELSDAEASELAHNLLNVYKIVYRIPPETAVSVLNRINGGVDNLSPPLVEMERYNGGLYEKREQKTK
jgi:hypothetical protein